MSQLKTFLEKKVSQYNQPDFIESDPIQIPHLFSKKEDIEIVGFLTALIAWGKREMIIRNARKWMTLMDDSPHEFILHHKPKDLKPLRDFKHRTFQFTDTVHVLTSLQHIYQKHGGLEDLFTITPEEASPRDAIMRFRKIFFSIPYEKRTEKHVPNPEKGSASKRLHMFLRWMVRKDRAGVDLGLWRNIPPSKLSCPLDIHSGRVARRLGLLSRKQNDIKAVMALDQNLRSFDQKDPVKYDFALFGLGIFENF
ncbi:MAG: TIGR02757 family protein [Flavobacteriales bacterium]